MTARNPDDAYSLEGLVWVYHADRDMVTAIPPRAAVIILPEPRRIISTRPLHKKRRVNIEAATQQYLAMLREQRLR